jgi:hypothetical protein
MLSLLLEDKPGVNGETNGRFGVPDLTCMLSLDVWIGLENGEIGGRRGVVRLLNPGVLGASSGLMGLVNGEIGGLWACAKGESIPRAE